MARAVGVGGVFLKARDPKALSAWYAKHLGIPLQDEGTRWHSTVPNRRG